MFRVFLSMIAAASFASIFPQSSSAETVKTVSVRVHYGDLNLATDAGARTLLMRLTWASRQVCGGRVPSGSMKAFAQRRACIREKVSMAVAELGSPVVMARLAANR